MNEERNRRLTNAQRDALRRRGEQIKTAGSLLGRIFLGSSKEQREALDTIAEGVDAETQGPGPRDDEAIVVHAELVEEEDEDP